MKAISSDEEYKLTMRKIHMLMGLGSQRISNEQMGELTELSKLASAYEQLRYDYTSAEQKPIRVTQAP